MYKSKKAYFRDNMIEHSGTDAFVDGLIDLSDFKTISLI